MQLARHHRSAPPTLHYAAWLLLFSWPGWATAQPKDSARLVDKLATTNPPATVRGKPGKERAYFGKETDRTERERVDAALKEVTGRNEELWLELVDHLRDDRHCTTVGIDAMYPQNWSVGDVCQHIIGETLSEPYYRHLPGTKENFKRFKLPAIANDKAKLREWCLARKDRKLFELQIELCEWALEEIKVAKTRADEKELTTAIQKEIEALQKSQTAIRCKRLW